MKSINMPGFTAEAACYLKSMTHYRTSMGRHDGTMPAVTPQLWRSDNFWQNGGWTITQTWYDDPGGWGVSPGIGDVTERQCRARCNKVANRELRAECLDGC